MKRILLILFCLTSPFSSFSSHLMGGEITWTVDSLNRFIFEVKLYRDCNGIQGPNQVNLVTNAPSGSINCTLFQTIDISPAGPGCPTCANPLGYSSAVQEFIFRSQPVLLSGTPPPGGWLFTYDDCCRNGNIVNLSNQGSGVFVLRAIMYANHLGVVDGTDNSPYFGISPTLAACPGEQISYSHVAFDNELDSLTYEWAESIDMNGAYPYVPGYSYQSPLPGPSQNPGNVAATLHPSTGAMSFRSYTTGNFVTVTRVSSWKCGVKTAEIFREIQVSIVPECIITHVPPVSNMSPEVTILKGGNPISFDTLLAGDSVNYAISAQDIQMDSLGNFQQIELHSLSPHFGANYTDPLIGCLIPPCATLSQPAPQSGPIVLANSMNFITSCAHAGLFNGCLSHNRSYAFTFKAKDNFCPANGIQFKTLMIEVHGPVITQQGNDLVVSYQGAAYQWYLNGVPISGATDSVFTPVQGGIYSVIATMPGGCQMVSNAVNRTFAGLNENQSTDFIQNLYVDENKILHAIFNATGTPNAVINIYDVQGKTVKQISVTINAGEQHIVIPVGELQPAFYMIAIQSGSSRQVRKFKID